MGNLLLRTPVSKRFGRAISARAIARGVSVGKILERSFPVLLSSVHTPVPL